MLTEILFKISFYGIDHLSQMANPQLMQEQSAMIYNVIHNKVALVSNFSATEATFSNFRVKTQSNRLLEAPPPP
jgi:hypothetical protein